MTQGDGDGDVDVIEDPDDPRLAPWLGLREHTARQRREAPGGDMAGHFMADKT